MTAFEDGPFRRQLGLEEVWTHAWISVLASKRRKTEAPFSSLHFGKISIESWPAASQEGTQAIIALMLDSQPPDLGEVNSCGLRCSVYKIWLWLVEF